VGGKGRKKGEARLPRDKEVLKHGQYIHLKNVDLGTLSEPMETGEVLKNMDLATETLICVRLPGRPTEEEAEAPEEAPEVEEADPDAAEKARPKQPEIPICIVMGRAKYEEKLEEARREKRRKDLGTKELEVSWGIDKHDLGHKLRRLREFLSKGYTVHVFFMSKKRAKKRATPEEAKETVRQVLELVAEVPGVVECRKREGEVGKSMKMYFEAPGGRVSKKSRNDAAAQDEAQAPE
jgi:translation initiation factor IF-3